MGEARRRKALRHELLSDGAVCIFCGGTTPATTVDHIPPRVMFDRRQRPKGMEFPACKACNDGSRKAELVAGMFARLWPDPEPGILTQEQARLIRSADDNVPGLVKELMQLNKRQAVHFNANRSAIPRSAAAPLNAAGPILNKAMLLFGAKLGMALFFHDLDRVLPSEGAIFVRWYSSYEALTGHLPEEIFTLMGAPTSLKQGSWTVWDQFQFRSAIPPNRMMAAHVSVFRRSFGILTLSAADNRHMVKAPQDHVFRPGRLYAA